MTEQESIEPTIRHILHSLALSESDKQLQITGVFRSSGSITSRCKIIHALINSSFMSIDRESVRLCLQDPVLLYPIIEGIEADTRCGKFLLEYIRHKSELNESSAAETLRLLRTLQDQSGARSSQRIPYSSTLAFLCQVWAQVEGSIPPHLLRGDKLIQLMFRWLESSPLGTGSDRQHILRIIKSYRKTQQSAIEYNMKLLSIFLSGAMRSAHPMEESSEIPFFPENLQLILPLLDQESLPICLYAILERSSVEDMFQLFRVLVSWTPLSPSKENIHLSKSRFDGSLFPLFPFLTLFIRVTAKLGAAPQKRASFTPDWRVVLESLVRIVAVKLADLSLVPDAAELLVYMLKLELPGRSSPSFLLAGGDRSMVPVGEYILSFAETLFNKHTMAAVPSFKVNESLEFLSALIRILQDDLLAIKRGTTAPTSGLSLQLPTGALEAARLSSIGAKPQVQLLTSSVLPADSSLLLQPIGPLQTTFVPEMSLVAPIAGNEYPTGQGVDVAFRTGKFAGIQNFNNTCYLSSFLQSLFLTDGFLASVYAFNLAKMEKTDEADFVQGTKVISGLRLVFARLLKTHHPHIEISEFIRSLPPSYRSGEQQDVTESGRWLFDKMGGTDQSLVKSVFGGEMIHKTKCHGCNNVTERREVFTDLCVSVPKAAEVLGKKRVTVQSLIKKMLKPESLTGDNKYSCDTCGKKQDASRWIEITQLPNHLMLVMHKFSFDIATCDFKKETTPVHPDDGVIDLVGGKYELYASVLHYGESAMKGHYVALGKRSGVTSDKSQQWALMDDSTVAMISEPEAMERISGLHKPTDAAYVLFFRSVNAPVAKQLRIPQATLDEALAVEAAAVHL